MNVQVERGATAFAVRFPDFDPRSAQHRYHGTIRNTDRYGRLESKAHPRLVSIIDALSRAEFVRAS
jgi:hypothetical protein